MSENELIPADPAQGSKVGLAWLIGFLVLAVIALSIGFGILFPQSETENKIIDTEIRLNGIEENVEILSLNQKILAANDSAFASVINGLNRRLAEMEKKK